MDFCRTIMHVVQPGDTFYRLAQRYQTTVPDIIMRNPGVNPYNLQVGTRLRICAGQMENPMQKDEMDLNNDMREAWSDHGFWATLYLLGQNYELPNAGALLTRLVKTGENISNVFGKFYSKMMTDQLQSLLNEHIELAGQLMSALSGGRETEAAQVEERLRQNAEKLARMLSSANPEYRYEELQRMMNMHLDLMKRRILADLAKNYDTFVEATDEGQKHLLHLADELTMGLIRQFYQTQQN